MATISPSRFFLAPLFSEGRKESFEWKEEGSPLLPDEVFRCTSEKFDGNREMLPPSREPASIFSLIDQGSGKRVIFFATRRNRMPAFWRIELFDEISGEPLTDIEYLGFWQIRKDTRLSYVTFREGKRGTVFSATGRLLEVFLYVLFYETASESVAELASFVQRSEFREAIEQHGEELNSLIEFQSEDTGRPILQQLAARHKVVGSIPASKLKMGSG